MQVVSGVLQASLQQAGALDVLLLVCGSEHLHGLFVDQSPEVLEGDVLPAFDAHLLQNLSQTFLVLQTLCDSRQLIGDQGLELGGVHGRLVVCSFVKLCDQRVDGQLQI